jgi:hypothetical protein
MGRTYPAYSLVTAQHSWHIISRIAVATNTGFLPVISENGARNMGPIANPQQKVVIPTNVATSLVCHSLDIWEAPGL